MVNARVRERIQALNHPRIHTQVGLVFTLTSPSQRRFLLIDASRGSPPGDGPGVWGDECEEIPWRKMLFLEGRPQTDGCWMKGASKRFERLSVVPHTYLQP